MPARAAAWSMASTMAKRFIEGEEEEMRGWAMVQPMDNFKQKQQGKLAQHSQQKAAAAAAAS